MPRRQNPPQANLDKSAEYARYTSEVWTISFYGVCCLLYTLIAGGFIILTVWLMPQSEVLRWTFNVAFILALGAMMIGKGIEDPWRTYFRDKAKLWRTPFPLTPVTLSFNPRLKTGESFKIQTTIFLANRWHSEATKARIIAVLNAAFLEKFSPLESPPPITVIQQTIDPPLDEIAEELESPVMYGVIENVTAPAMRGEDVELGEIL